MFDKKDSPSYEKLWLDDSHFIEKYHQVDLFTLDSEGFEALWNYPLYKSENLSDDQGIRIARLDMNDNFMIM